MNTVYSGKQGVTTTNSSPSSHSAWSVTVSDAAAPQVMYTPSADMGTPNAVRMYCATASRTSGAPAAEV